MIGIVTAFLFLSAPFADAAMTSASYNLVVEQRICRTRPTACKLIAHSSFSSSPSSSASSISLAARFPLNMTLAQWNALVLSKHRSGGHQSATESTSSAAPIVHATPTFTLGDLTKNYGDIAFTLSPTTNSTGTISYSSGNTSVATISGNTVTITGAGTTVITATLAADSTYLGATATATLTVNPIAPTIASMSNIIKTPTDLPFTVFNPASNSTGTFSYTSSDPSVASISGNIISIHSTGLTTITATQAANGNYTSGTQTFTVNVVTLSEA